MTANPAGFVVIADGGQPDRITGRAITAITAGQVCYAGSKLAAVSSGTNSFADADIWIASHASGTNHPVGIATITAASGAEVVIQKNGLVIMTADAAFAPTAIVCAGNGASAVSALGSAADPVAVYHRKLGRALTGAGSEGYAIINVEL